MKTALGSVLVLAAVAILVVALVGVIRGRLDRIGLHNRTQAARVAGVATALFFLGGSLLPEATQDEAEPVPAAVQSTSVTPSSTSAVLSTTRTTAPVAPAPPPVTIPRAPLVDVPTVETPEPSRSGGATYYGDCDAVRAAGAAPLFLGEPGYRAKLDRDGDGVACEVG
ncbi:excalibur calcium-binding domain-containing protein [Skermania piniformis]|uniref:excalibur calcium-binding domain-containing protein n=1 Tax=Skermania pinensis TaxID=39122 RepID=UPI0008321E69